MNWKHVFMVFSKTTLTIITTLYAENKLEMFQNIPITFPVHKEYIIHLLAGFGLLTVFGKMWSWILDKIYKRIGWMPNEKKIS